MADPNTDLQSKINRAVRAVILSVGAGTVNNTYAAPFGDVRILPNTSISTGDGIPFDGPGNWHFPNVIVNLRDDGAIQPDATDPNQPRIDANLRLTGIYNALNRSNDTTTLYFTAGELTRLGRLLAVDQSGGTDPVQAQSAADNADMADFTVLWWEGGLVGTPTRHESDGHFFWERELGFGCVACNTALPA